MLHGIGKADRGDLAGGGELVGLNEFFVEFPVRDRNTVKIFHTVDTCFQRYDGDVGRLGFFGQVVGAGINDNLQTQDCVPPIDFMMLTNQRLIGNSIAHTC